MKILWFISESILLYTKVRRIYVRFKPDRKGKSENELFLPYSKEKNLEKITKVRWFYELIGESKPFFKKLGFLYQQVRGKYEKSTLV